jgi:hypothetical protein
MKVSEYRFSFPACMIAGKGRIDTYDVLMLRRYAFPEGIRRAADAQAMFALHNLCPTQCDEWESYFVEGLAGYIVNSGNMPGVIDERKAIWLIRATADNGAVRSWLEIELMLHAMEIADSICETLPAFALDQVRIALMPEADPIPSEPQTAYGLRRPAHAGITVFDLAYIWRVLRPAVEKGRIILSALEWTVLREIDELAPRNDHHPGWNEIMAQLSLFELHSALMQERASTSRWLGGGDDPMQEDYAA